MTTATISKLSQLAANIKNVLPSFFTGTNEDVAFVDADVDKITMWMQREKYMTFSGLQVPVPPGLNVYMTNHLAVLTEVFDVAQRLIEDVLMPVDRALAALTHQPELLTIPVGFRWKEVKFPLRHIKPEDLTKQLAACFTGPAERDARELNRVYHSASEIDAVYVRMNVLRDAMKRIKRKDINKLIESIGYTTSDLEDRPMHPQVVKELALMLDTASEWISLFGVVMKQIEDAANSVDLTVQKLKKMYENDKK